jgi:poly-gamma-glutamate capsule biosynthesis protein CapA/YwtB (metallophosphatase superfamily)
MNHDDTPRFRPVDMPRDTRSLLRFEGEFGAAVDRHLAEADDGRWDRSIDILIDPKDPLAIAHWVYKSINPVVRPARCDDHDIAALFEPFRRTRFAILPEGFATEKEITLSASGDLMCTPGLDHAKDRLFLEVEELVFGADIAYANLESTLTTGEIHPTEFSAGSPPMINLTPEQYETLTSHRGQRFDVLHLANNHILDCGEEGILTTLARLDQDGIAQVGVNRAEDDARHPQIIELAGLRIGWVAHTFSVNFKPFPPDKPWIVNMTPFHLVPDPDTGPIERQIKACRNAQCDLVVVALHWGLEFELYPAPQQIEWARRFAEAGADLVIGHHPHVAQPIEIYRPKNDPDRAVPILYSIGNLSTLMSHPAMVLSLVARIRIAQGQYRGRHETRVAGVDLTPVALVAEDGRTDDVARLVPLAKLARSTRSGPMGAYVDEVVRYADIIVGADWREAS